MTWAAAGVAQTVNPVPAVSTTVTVLGSPEAVTLGESNRSTVVIERPPSAGVFSEAEDYLRTDSSVFVEQRGAGGSQADVSIRGTTFEQALVLLNGLRIDDAETSHNNLDLPIPLEAMRSMDVLHGAGSTLYGTDAIGGVIDFVTAGPTDTSLLVRAGGGNYGTNEQEAIGSIAGRRCSEVIAGGRDASSGFRFDRDYRDEEGSSESRCKSRLGTTDVLLAGDDRAFGANQFYGDYPSWERTKGWFASIRQQLGARADTAFGYRRHTDEYILFRDDPAIYENNHVDTSWEGALRRNDAVGRHLKLFYGLEGDGDGIHSTNLGVHARTWGSGYVDAEMGWGRFSLSAGLRQEVISGGYKATSPMVGAGYHLTEKLKLRGEAGYGFRLPTYLDLYYSDPTTRGNAALKPESAWNVEGGADWFPTSHLGVSSTVFSSRQRNAIDYVRADVSQPWVATNLSGLRFTGVENSATWQPNRDNRVRASWTLLAGAQRALHGMQSEYVFNYPVNNASVDAMHVWKAGVGVQTRLGVTERYHQTPYAVWDIALSYRSGYGESGHGHRGDFRPYVRATNVTNTGYQEVLGVQMPGRTVVAGVEICMGRHGR